MTRQDFVDDINSFWDLIGFCRDEQLDTCNDIFDGDELDEYVMRTIRHDFDTWQGIRDFLSDIPVGGEYYGLDGYGNIICVDGMFEDYKADVMRTMDQCDAWDEEESFDEDEAYDDELLGLADDDLSHGAEVEIDDASFLAVVGRSI